jgi:thymidylate synthase (FAD)
MPDEWRSAPENSKQGSGEPVNVVIGAKYTQALRQISEYAMTKYEEALSDGVAPEMARLMLPAYSMYVRWRWTVSLQGVLTFLDQRLPHDAQVEIQEYAKAVRELVKEKFPLTYEVYTNE